MEGHGGWSARAPELRSKLELSINKVSFREVREDAVAYIERRRDASTRPVPMDIGSQEEEEDEEEYSVRSGVPELGLSQDPPELEDASWGTAERGDIWEEPCYLEVAQIHGS